MAKLLLIKWKRPNIYRCGDVRLMPGLNEVHEKFWDEVKSMPAIKKRMEMGLLELVKHKKAAPDSDEDKGVEDKPEPKCIIVECEVKDAIKIVKETLDHAKLEEWKSIEKRKSVLKVIESQIKMLNEPPQKKKETEGDE